jgi:parallel beta-helix repeat protein
MVLTALRKLFRARKSSPPRRRAGACRPAVESLESRLVPSTLVVGKPGSSPRPDFTSIQAAINAAHPGDTIRVGPGTYQEQLTISKNDLRVVARGGPCDTPVTIMAPGGSGALVDISGQNVLLQGFSLDGGSSPTLSYGVLVHGGSGTIQDNRIAHFQGPETAQLGFGIYADTRGRLEIESNRIEDYNKGGILVKGGARVEIEHNVVRGDGPTAAVAQNGIQIGDFPAASGDPYNKLQVTRAEVENNFVTGNVYTNSAADGFEAAGILVVNQAGGVEVEHNLLTGNQDAIFLSDVSGSRIEGNVARGNTADGILLLGDRVGDPRTGRSLTSGNVVSHNDTSCNGRSGIDLFDADNNVLAGNAARGNAQDGLTLSTSDRNDVERNRASGNGRDGIALFWSRGNELEGNLAFGNSQDGIALLPADGSSSAASGSNNNTLEHNTAVGNGRDGVRVEDSRGNVLRGNRACDNGGKDVDLTGDTSGTTGDRNQTGGCARGRDGDRDDDRDHEEARRARDAGACQSGFESRWE